MKYKTKDYAKALAGLMLENRKNIPADFLRILQKNGDMKKAKEIIDLAGKLYLEKTGNKKVVLQTARKAKHAAAAFVKKGDIVVDEINPSLVAGIKIIVNGERQLDFSLSKKLNEIFS